MAETTLEFIGEQLARMLTEQQAMRAEMRRLSENQLMTARSVSALRDDLELMIKVEIGGLFAHLETRLENRIEDILSKATP
jgi:hypothetical protein